MKGLKNKLLVLTIVLSMGCNNDIEEAGNANLIKHESSVKHAGRGSKQNSSPNTYLLVHGAWHPEGVWSKIKVGLENEGHVVHTVQLSGLGTDCTDINNITLQDHVDIVKNSLGSITEPVILVGHSYGGVVISQVAEQMPQKINKLVYVSAFMLENNESLVDIALQDTASLVTQNIIINGNAVSIPKEDYVDAFYNFSSGNNNPNLEEDVEFVVSLLKDHPFTTFTTPVSLGTNYEALQKVYVSCTADQAITPDAQVYMYSRFSGTTVFTLQNADHSPFMSRPNQLINVLKGL